MAGFLTAAILLSALVGLVLGWPLRRHSRWLPAAFAVAVTVIAIGLYQVVGTPAALDPARREPPADLAQAVIQLEAELAANPDQPEGWRLLGRAYRAQDRLDDSVRALRKAAGLTPDDPDTQVEYAEALAQADPDKRFGEEATRILHTVLERDPQHSRARLMLGVAQRQAGQDAEAARTWQALLPQLGPEAADSLRTQIAAAREAAGLPPLSDTPDSQAAPDATADGVTVRVRLDEHLAARVRLDPAAVLFVIARAPDGPPMPVAVARRSAGELPLQLVLDDSDSPMPTRPLSALAEVELVARISATGSATPSEDDLSSVPVRIRLPATEPVELVLGAAK